MSTSIRKVDEILEALSKGDFTSLYAKKVKTAWEKLDDDLLMLKRQKGVEFTQSTLIELLTKAELGEWTELREAQVDGKLEQARDELKYIATYFRANNIDGAGVESVSPRTTRVEELTPRVHSTTIHSPRAGVSFETSTTTSAFDSGHHYGGQSHSFSGHFRTVSRPQDVAAQFSDFYNDEWTTAFDTLCLDFEEEEVATTLVQVLQQSFHFCETVAENQLSSMMRHLEADMMYPNMAEKSALSHQVHPGKEAFNIVKGAEPDVRHLRKELAYASVPAIKAVFREEAGRSIISSDMLNSATAALELYTDRSVELTWLMVIQDPPMHLLFCEPYDVHTDRFRPLRRGGGSDIMYCVFPALLMHKHGSVMKEGVAQYG